jgi:hypothetical protein
VRLDPPRLPALGERWHEAAADILGELGVRTWLEAAVPAEIAARAAAGWGGDRATLFEATSAPVAADGGVPDGGALAGASSSFVAWSTAWDDVTDAEDFARTAATALAALARDPSASFDDPNRFVARDAAGVYALAWRGGVVSLLLGAPESALPALDGLMARAPSRPPLRPRPRR